MAGLLLELRRQIARNRRKEAYGIPNKDKKKEEGQSFGSTKETANADRGSKVVEVFDPTAMDEDTPQPSQVRTAYEAPTRHTSTVNRNSQLNDDGPEANPAMETAGSKPASSEPFPIGGQGSNTVSERTNSPQSEQGVADWQKTGQDLSSDRTDRQRTEQDSAQEPGELGTLGELGEETVQEQEILSSLPDDWKEPTSMREPGDWDEPLSAGRSDDWNDEPLTGDEPGDWDEPTEQDEDWSRLASDALNSTQNIQESDDYNIQERTVDTVSKEDFLINQIDEFRERAQQLQSLLDSRESEAKEMQSLIDERQEKAQELEQVLKERQEQSAELEQMLKERQEQTQGITIEVEKQIDSLIEKVSVKLDEIEASMREDVEDGKRYNDEKTQELKESLELLKTSLQQVQTQIVEQLTATKTDLSDKVHTENVKCFRNISDLFKNVDEKMNGVQGVDKKIAPIKNLGMVSLIFGILNFIAMVILIFVNLEFIFM